MAEERPIKLLKDLGITRVLVESGGEFITSLFREKLIDKFYWFQSNKIIGNDGIAAINNLNIKNIKNANEFELMNIKRFGDDILRTLIHQENFSKISCYF